MAWRTGAGAGGSTQLRRLSIDPWERRKVSLAHCLAKFVGQFGQFPASGHFGGEFFEGDLGALLVQHSLPEFEDDEVVPDKVGVVRVVGDEDDSEAGITGGCGVFQ